MTKYKYRNIVFYKFNGLILHYLNCLLRVDLVYIYKENFSILSEKFEVQYLVKADCPTWGKFRKERYHFLSLKRTQHRVGKAHF